MTVVNANFNGHQQVKAQEQIPISMERKKTTQRRQTFTLRRRLPGAINSGKRGSEVVSSNVMAHRHSSKHTSVFRQRPTSLTMFPLCIATCFMCVSWRG